MIPPDNIIAEPHPYNSSSQTSEEVEQKLWDNSHSRENVDTKTEPLDVQMYSTPTRQDQSIKAKKLTTHDREEYQCHHSFIKCNRTVQIANGFLFRCKTRIIAVTPVSVGFTAILIVLGSTGTRMMNTKPNLQAGISKYNTYCYSMC